MTPTEIIACLDNWNSAKYSADARDELRRALGWRPGSHASFGARIAEALANGSSRPAQPAQANRPPTAEHALNIIEEMMFDRVMVHRVAHMLLNANWDFSDPSGMMQKDPDDVEDFLESCALEISKWSEMHPSRKNLFKMICDAYLRSLRQQPGMPPY